MFKQRLVNLFSDAREPSKEEKQPKPANSMAQAAVPNTTTNPSTPPTKTKTPDMVLVEREAEIAKLQALWEAACTGHGRVVLIAGEAGFGKSSLADWVLQTLAYDKTPHKIAKAACSAQSGQDEPFWPFADCMSQLVAAPTNKKVTEDVLDAILEFAPSWVSVIPVAGPVVEAGLKTA